MEKHFPPQILEELPNLETIESDSDGLNLPELLIEFKNFGFDYKLEDLRSEIAKVLPEFIQALEQNLIVPIYAQILSTGNFASFIQLKKIGVHEHFQDLVSRIDQIRVQILETVKDSRSYRGYGLTVNSSAWIEATRKTLDQLSIADKLNLITYMRTLGFGNLNQLLAEWYAEDTQANKVTYKMTPNPE